MTLNDAIHQSFHVGKGDCRTIEDAIPANRERMRRAALLEDPDTIHEYFAEYDLVVFNMAMAALVEKGAFMPLDELRRDVLANGTACLDDEVNQRIEELWALVEDSQRYDDYERAMA